MIQGHEKFQIFDEVKGRGNNFFMEVNWKGEKDEETNNCKLIKFVFPDGKESLIKKEHLNAVLFALGTAAEQMKMIPQKLSRVKWYETVLGITATKDVRKGEKLIFPIKLSMPSEEQEAIAEIKGEMVSKGGIILPK